MKVRAVIAAWAFMLVGTAFYLAGCQSMTGETAGQNLDDSMITSEIKTKLAGEKLMNTTRVSVKTERGVVYLTGAVPTIEERDKATDISRNIKGVKKVFNHLEIMPEMAKSHDDDMARPRGEDRNVVPPQ